MATRVRHTIGLCLAAATLLFCAVCKAPVAPASLAVDGAEQTAEDQARDTLCSVWIQEEEDTYTAVGQVAYAAFPSITNGGESDLVIEAIRVYEPVYDEDGTITESGYNQGVFALVEGTRPDLPLVLAGGQSLSNLMVSFSPRQSGRTLAIVALDTNVGKQYVALEGTGAWNLTLSVEAGGQGRIVAPVEVLDGAPVVYRSPTDTVELQAESTHPLQLTELDAWVGTGAVSIESPAAATTTVTLSGHASVEADFYEPYLRVPSGTYATLDDAFLAFNPDDPDYHKGIVVAAGTHVVTGTLSMIRGVLLGGYNSTFAARAYLTPEDRADTTYQTILQLSGSIDSGAGAGVTSTIEGFVIQGAASADALSFHDGAQTVVRYNDIVAGTDHYAIYATSAQPTIEGNVITGSAATGDSANPDTAAICLVGSGAIVRGNTINVGSHGVRTVGVLIADESGATLSDNVITGGTTDIAGALAVGVYVSLFSEPLIEANAVTGGTSSGAGGLSMAIFVGDGCSPRIHDNTLDGGTGTTQAFSIYLYRSGLPVIIGNQLLTTPADGATGYGVYAGYGSRIRTLAGNHFSAVDGGLLYLRELTGEVSVITSIDELNEKYVPEPTEEEPVNTAE